MMDFAGPQLLIGGLIPLIGLVIVTVLAYLVVLGPRRVEAPRGA